MPFRWTPSGWYPSMPAGATYRPSRDHTRDQLRQQKIIFTPLDNLTPEEHQPTCLLRYAGQQLTTGKQAECYANDFIDPQQSFAVMSTDTMYNADILHEPAARPVDGVVPG